MDFVKGLFDSDKESDSGSAKKNRQKMNKNFDKADKYNSKKKAKKDEDVTGVPRRPNRSNKVGPGADVPDQSVAMNNLDSSEDMPEIPMRPKSRAVILPSGLIIGSEDDSSVHTSTLSSHSSDSFNPRNGLPGLARIEVEDVDNGLVEDDKKSSTVKRQVRTLDGAGRRKSSAHFGRSVSAPAGEKLSLAERRTLRRAERVGVVEKKQLPFFTRIAYEFTMGIQKTTRKIQEGFRNAQIWGPSIKELEGNLGSGVSTYFRVLRWLLKINVISMVMALGLIATPGIWMNEHHDLPDTSLNKDDLNCTNPNFVEGNDTAADVANYILQFLTGQGWMEGTALYLGWYPASNITRTSGDTEKTTYNFPLAYLLVGLAYFLVALMFILNNIARLFKKSAAEKIETKTYSELILTGWDYTIQNKKTAQLRSTTVIKSLKEALSNDAQKFVKISFKKEIGIIVLRVCTNCVAVAAMIGTVFLYYREVVRGTSEDAANSTNACGEKLETADFSNLTDIEINEISAELITRELARFWSSYSASIIVSLSNILFPIFFEFLGQYEFYRFQSTRIAITMVRSFVMKLFSVCVFLYVLYQATKPSGGIMETWQRDNNTLLYNCWENYIGAQLYQLCIIDFIVFCTSLFFSEVLRNILINNIKWFRSKVEQPEFNIPKEILDLCYKQMIFWSAIFFSPLMCCVAVIEVIVIFYLRKASALRNVRPPQKVVLTSQSSSMVNAVFLVSLIFVFVFVGLVIFQFKPSAHCGPFRGKTKIHEPLGLLIENSGGFKTYIYDNLKMTAVIVSIVIIVLLIIYYFKSLAASRNLTIKLLRHQIKVEHVDKQFLIEHIKSQITGKPVQEGKKDGTVSRMSHSQLSGELANKTKKNMTIHRYANPSLKI
ncbi:hypothetical protein ACHWQZ_G017491 [Mnemiopsis leidyi]